LSLPHTVEETTVEFYAQERQCQSHTGNDMVSGTREKKNKYIRTREKEEGEREGKQYEIRTSTSFTSHESAKLWAPSGIIK
jgi:hypothetical protein